LLKQNYQILGNWPLAITAYNHGTDGIFRGIKAVESDDLVDLIRGYQSPTFGFASKNFYAEFLAVVQIARNSETFFPFLRHHRPVNFHEVALKRPVALNAVLKPAAISHSQFFAWNPALEPTTKVLPLGYRVNLPAEKVDQFVSAQSRAGEGRKIKKTMAANAQSSVAAAKSRGAHAQRIVAPPSRRAGEIVKAKASPIAKRQGSNKPPQTLKIVSR